MFRVPDVLSTLGNERHPAPGRFDRCPIVPCWPRSCSWLGHLVLQHTRFGRYVYATGGNREAARLAGVRTGRIVIGLPGDLAPWRPGWADWSTPGA